MSSKQRRTYAKGRFTRAVNCFEAFLHTDGADDKNLKKYYEDVEATWKIVEERNEEYIITVDEVEEAKNRG